jgi:lipocalin-like protein
VSASVSWTLGVATALVACSHTQSPAAKDARPRPAEETLVGAWRLATLDEPGADGRTHRVNDAKGSLIYTADGRMSVQVMYATAETSASSAPVQYAQGGYEGSFGRYDVDEATRTVTHHVEGANVRALVGRDLPRLYELSPGRLTLRPTRTDEHWSVVWVRP